VKFVPEYVAHVRQFLSRDHVPKGNGTSLRSGKGFGGGGATVPAFCAKTAAPQFRHIEVGKVRQVFDQELLVVVQLIPFLDLGRMAALTL
jgi:hypothetical protein